MSTINKEGSACELLVSKLDSEDLQPLLESWLVVLH